MKRVEIALDDEHLAMLDAICIHGMISRRAMVQSLLYALLEDDAAAHGASTPTDNIIILRNYRRP